MWFTVWARARQRLELRLCPLGQNLSIYDEFQQIVNIFKKSINNNL